MNAPTEKQLASIESLLGKRDNGYHSDAWAAIERIVGVKAKKATTRDASKTIDTLKAGRAT